MLTTENWSTIAVTYARTSVSNSVQDTVWDRSYIKNPTKLADYKVINSKEQIK